MAITSDFEAQTAVQRELVLRLASVLWRLRRATAIESGLLELQARRLLQLRRARQAKDCLQSSVVALHQHAIEAHPRAPENHDNPESEPLGCVPSERQRSDLTRSFLGLAKMPDYPLDRLSRYEANLWRQASQILFALRFLDHPMAWVRKYR